MHPQDDTHLPGSRLGRIPGSRLGRRPLSRLLQLAFALALLVPAAEIAAQTGTITGKVVKEDGTPADYVDVSLEPEAGFTHSDSTLTEGDGTFRFAAIPVGNYKLSAFADGMKPKETIANIGVTSGSSQAFTITLIPAEVQTVTVVVNGKLEDILDIRKTDTSMTLEGGFIAKLPLQNKRIQDIVFLFPGVNRNGSSDSTDLSVGGGTSGQIGYRVNGQSINDTVNGGALFDLPTQAIGSFKLITNGFAAEHGEQSAAIADIVTKAGTDEIDFSYSMDFRDTDYGAQPVSGLDAAAKDVDDILRAEGTPFESELEAGFRLLGVDTISTLDDDHNPTPRHRVRHDISTGGPIVRQKVFFHSTLETTSDDFGNPYANGSFQNDQVLFTGKLNWNDVFKSKHVQSNNLEFTANVDVTDDSGFAGLRSTRSTNTVSSKTAWSIGLTDINVFNDTTVLETKLSYTHSGVAVRPEDVRTGVGTQYEVYLPPAGFTSYFVGAAGVSFDETIDTTRADVSLSKAFDHHDLKTGITYQRSHFVSFQENGDDVRDLRVVDSNNLLGTPGQAGNYVQYGAPTRTDDKSWAAAIFVQDSWRITDNLSIDVGLRADYQSFIGEIFPSPRIGFSLDPVGDKKTRFYGNFGIFYDNVFANALEFAQTPETTRGDIFFTAPFQGSQARFSQLSIVDVWKEALATPINSQDVDSMAFAYPLVRDRYVVDPDLSAPLNASWSLGFERELPAHTRIQLSFAMIQRTHQLRTRVETQSVGTHAGEADLRDVILESTGKGKYEQWAFEFQRPFSDVWELNMSYTQSKNVGPIAPPEDPVDPNDVFYVDGPLGNSRPHVAKLQAHALLGKKKAKLDVSGGFTWQTGTPITPRIVQSDGTTFYPLGRNSLRLPPSRQLDFGMQRAFKTADDQITVTGRLQFFNLLNEMNVFGAIGVFETPEGSVDPFSFPPVRADLLVTDVDVGRSAELGIVIGF